MAPSPLSWQPSLLAAEPPAVDAAFSTLVRVQLDGESWVDHAPGWLSGSDEVFADLVAGMDWGQRSRWMYDRRVDEPRLTAGWSAADGVPLRPPVLDDARRRLSERYGVTFDSVGINLYRDGRDSVAWHRDRIPPEVVDPIVGLVSLGEPRRFLLRPAGGGPSRRFHLGRGDLTVTGGRCQRQWDHCVPKVAVAGPRISVAFRHGRYNQSPA